MKTLLHSGVIFLLTLVPAAVKAQAPDSGLAIGTDCPAYDPQHVSGPDKGTKACPMCKYGSQQGVMIWVNNDDWEALRIMAQRLESEINVRGLRNFRAFIMYMNPDKKPLAEVRKMLTDFSTKLKLSRAAITYIPDPSDADTAGLFEISPSREVKNTVLIYKKRAVVGKFINLEPSKMSDLMSTCDKLFTKGSS
ncbi:MAG: hypothetical protein SH819_00875 [Cytophagales bacterium]|nr:hypothetical protein [Cytophagales bacterium]